MIKKISLLLLLTIFASTAPEQSEKELRNNIRHQRDHYICMEAMISFVNMIYGHKPHQKGLQVIQNECAKILKNEKQSIKAL